MNHKTSKLSRGARWLLCVHFALLVGCGPQEAAEPYPDKESIERLEYLEASHNIEQLWWDPARRINFLGLCKAALYRRANPYRNRYLERCKKVIDEKRQEILQEYPQNPSNLTPPATQGISPPG